MSEQEQEQISIPTWPANTLTAAAIGMFVLGLCTVGLHIWDSKRFPPPKDLGIEILMGLSVITIFALYFPWDRIKFGNWEIERKRLQENILQRELDIAELIEEPETPHEVDNGTIVTENELVIGGGESRSYTKSNFSLDHKENVRKFFGNWPTWGFTPSRVLKWGSGQTGFESLKTITPTQLRAILTILVRDGDLRIRVSAKGNILYQYIDKGEE